MTDTNRHGLSRHIPESIAREVRQECGFGCVLCGTALYHYEHISPEFKDADSHDPDNIALLCANHHDRVTRKHLSKETIAKARLKPKAKNSGVATSSIEMGSEGFKVVMGGATFDGGACIGALGELPLLLLLPPEDAGEPARLTAFFPASDGRWSLAIYRNEWRVLSHTVWDVKVEGAEITIRKKAGETILQFRTQPPHCFEVISLDVKTKKYSANLEAEGLLIADATGQRHLRFGNSSHSSGVMAFVDSDFACLLGPFPTPSQDPNASWRDFLLNLHWEAGRRSHGSMVIRPDGAPPKLFPNSDGTALKLPSFGLLDQATGNPVRLSEEAEVLALFSFGSPHCHFLPVGAQAVGPK